MLVMLAAALVLAAASTAAPVETPQPDHFGRVADKTFTVATDSGSGQARYFSNGSLEGDKRATRALIIVHGILRDADYYYDTAMRAVDAAKLHGVLVIAPQFVEHDDIVGLPSETLYWSESWPGGSDAIAPAPISTYEVFDAILARLADSSRFPALREITIAGHSAGGQIVQRYAVVGNAPRLDATSSTPVHLVVANPSSYFYFDDWRPSPQRNCPGFDRWRYGLAGAPRYVTGTEAQLESRYLRRHVTYLLGTNDTNPREDDLDRSCGGEAQGPYRYARGQNFIAYVRRNAANGSRQDYAFVQGVGHDNRRMFNSACGLAALFGDGVAACTDTGTI